MLLDEAQREIATDRIAAYRKYLGELVPAQCGNRPQGAAVVFFWGYLLAGAIDWLVVALILTVAAFLPSLIAFIRRHHNRYAILVLNVLLGWTIIGWVIALVWSLTAVWCQSPPAYET